MTLLTENPDMRGPLIANHGAIPLLDLIETCNQQSLVLKLLNILNMVRERQDLYTPRFPLFDAWLTPRPPTP